MGYASGLAACLLVAAASMATADRHEKFVPLVAFECGYRNRFMSENGSWVTDENKYATCMSGKLDILKYCQKTYSSLNVTNIVEYAHEVTLADWCREEGDKCTTTKTVRPFRCIVGEFHSEALQVPHDCRFNHENARSTCNDYQHWKREASVLCAQKKDESSGREMTVRSFAMLEPCGLDLFTGVEYVCCPKEGDADKALIAKEDELDSDEDSKDSEVEKEEDDDAESYDDEDNEDNDKKAEKVAEKRDEYFTTHTKDLAREHENYQEALDRMEQRHRVKVNKVMKEWNELDAKYNKMKHDDPINAELFKKEMTNRFQTTVAAQEEEHRKLRKEIEEVHEERVQSAMNEKKRIATHAYREALSEAVSNPNKHKILKTLKAYIRSEEKDRIHTLNRYRHLLHSDLQEAMNIKAFTVHRLRYIDLRINGTIAMLIDFPEFEKQLRPIAMEFWNDFRRENTPDITDKMWKEMEGFTPEEKDLKLVEYYQEQIRQRRPEAFLHIKMPSYTKFEASKFTTPKPAATPEPAKILPNDKDEDSEEENDSYYEDENDEELKKDKKGEEAKPDPLIKVRVTIILSKAMACQVQVTKAELASKAEERELEKKPIVRPAPKVVLDDSDEEDDSEDESDEDDEKELSGRKELRVDIEPIIDDKAVHVLPSYYRHDKMSRSRDIQDGYWPFSASGYVFAFSAIAFGCFLLFVALGIRHRRRHIRFIEVDVCAPEERHVSGMQVNGYENPTYSFFDSKA